MALQVPGMLKVRYIGQTTLSSAAVSTWAESVGRRTWGKVWEVRGKRHGACVKRGSLWRSFTGPAPFYTLSSSGRITQKVH